MRGFNTLRGHTKIEEREENNYRGPFFHRYYLTVVPNIFDRMFHTLLENFQYTASYYSEKSIGQHVISFV